MEKIGIIGAGISGLALAWAAKQHGINAMVLESGAHCGGAIQSFRKGPYLAEEGPNSIQVADLETEDFLHSVPGLKARIIESKPEAKKRFIVRDGRLHAVPMGPISAVTTPLWSFSGKLRVLKEPFIAPAPADGMQSVADFVRRRLGKELYQYAINPLVGGIYAGDPERLCLRYAFPKLHAMEQAHGGLIRGAWAKMRAAGRSRKPAFKKRIISFQDGMAELPAALATALGDQLRCGLSIQAIERAKDSWQIRWSDAQGRQQREHFDRIIVTVPAHSLPKLPFACEAIKAALVPLSAIQYPPVSTLSLAFKQAAITHPIDGFGALVPECEKRSILGVLFPSSIFQKRAPEGEALLTVFMGGDRQPELAQPETEKVLATALPELTQLLGLKGKPTFVHHRHWTRAIPQYRHTHREHFASIENIERTYPGLELAGNYRHGISLSYCLESAIGYFASITREN